jgi:hypothetical protein
MGQSFRNSPPRLRRLCCGASVQDRQEIKLIASLIEIKVRNREFELLGFTDPFVIYNHASSTKITLLE